MKPYYDDGTVTIYHGDCVDYLDNGDTFDVAVTSPPYNMGLVPGGSGRGMYRPGASNKAARFRDGYDGANDDALPQAEYESIHRGILEVLWTHVTKAVFYNHRPRVEHGLLRFPLSGNYGDLPLRQIIIWDRGTGIDVSLRQFCTRQEWVLLFARPDFKLTSHAASGMGDVWNLGMERGETGHPAPFPVSLPLRALSASGAKSVIDPYMGSGTTLVAAKQLGVRAVGVERVERYCEIAARRLDQGVLDFGSVA